MRITLEGKEAPLDQSTFPVMDFCDALRFHCDFAIHWLTPKTGLCPAFGSANRALYYAAFSALPSSRLLPPVRMSILRGFMDSGISRTRSMCSKPSSMRASTTFT